MGIHFTVVWVDPRATWTGVKIQASAGVRTPNRPEINESLYWLLYPGPYLVFMGFEILESNEFAVCVL